MLRSVALILIVGACGSCMEMRETVERMVMVRTTGSDLQPASTGYIYQKKNDGEESVIEMGESEVMQHLTKFYDQPDTYKVPIPKHARYVNYDNRQETKKDERVIPVKENEENVDGIADDDYRKSFEEYMSKYDNSRAYDDYLKGLEHFRGKYHHNHGQSEEDKDDKKYKGFHYGDDDGGNYQNQKYESYSFSGKGGHKNGHGEDDSHKKYYGNTQNHGGSKHGEGDVNGKEDNSKEHHKVYDNDGNKKEYGYFKGDHHNKFADGYKYHGARKGYGHDGSHESGHVSEKLETEDRHDAGPNEKQERKPSAEEVQSSHEKHADFGSKNGPTEGKSYGFKIKH